MFVTPRRRHSGRLTENKLLVGLSDAHAGFLDGFGTLRPRAIWGNCRHHRAMRHQCATVAGTFGAPRLASFWVEYSGRPPKRADMGALGTLEASECIGGWEEGV